MTRIHAAAVIAAIFSAVILTGCSKAPNVEGSAPAARVSALATSPAVLHAEAKLAPKATTCAKDNGVTLTITGAGTTQFKASVSHVKGTVMLHPVTTVEDIGKCLGLTKADLDKLKTYAETVVKANGFGKGSGTEDFTQIINYIAQLQS